jgi:hypothetical protein
MNSGLTDMKHLLLHVIYTNYSTRKIAHKKNKGQSSLASVRKQTIPTERPPLAGEVSVNLCG